MVDLNRNWTPLHLHTRGSLRDGIIKTSELVNWAKKNNKKYIAVTDHGAIGSWIELYEECKKTGIIPVFGIEGYIHPNREEYLEKKEGKLHHIVLLAQNEIGFKNIIKIHNEAWQNFYKKPIMSYDCLFTNSDGVIVSTACMSGTLSKHLIAKDIVSADSFIETMKENFPNRFFVELMLIDMEEQKPLNKQIIKIAKKHSVPLIVSNDTHYLTESDNKQHQILLLLQSNKTVKDLEEGKGWKFSAQDLWLKNEEELYDTWKSIYKNDNVFTEEILLEALNNSDLITDTVEELWLEHLPRLPKFKNNKKKLNELVLNGFEEKVNLGLIPKNSINEYVERVKYELKAIEDIDMIDYILLIHKIIQYCNDSDIATGAGRGSVSSSLVTWLIDITKIDPIKYDLLFERFINPARKTRLKIFGDDI